MQRAEIVGTAIFCHENEPLRPNLAGEGAMRSCGHIGLYEEEGTTRLSMLHPKFMTTLQAHPSLERAVERAEPAFETLLENVLEGS